MEIDIQNNQSASQESISSLPCKPRQTYVAPALMHYGAVTTLTQGSKAAGTDPGGNGRKNP